MDLDETAHCGCDALCGPGREDNIGHFEDGRDIAQQPRRVDQLSRDGSVFDIQDAAESTRQYRRSAGGAEEIGPLTEGGAYGVPLQVGLAPSKGFIGGLAGLWARRQGPVRVR